MGWTHWDSVRSALLGLPLIAVGVWLLWRAYRPATAIWRGAAHQVPDFGSRIGRPNHRAYPVFLLWITAFAGSGIVLGLGLTVGALAIEVGAGSSLLFGSVVAATVMFLVVPVLGVLQGVVTAFNRPRLLVSPVYRHEWGTWRARRSRQLQRQTSIPRPRRAKVAAQRKRELDAQRRAERRARRLSGYR